MGLCSLGPGSMTHSQSQTSFHFPGVAQGYRRVQLITTVSAATIQERQVKSLI